MKWEDARILIDAIKKSNYVPKRNEVDVLTNAKRHIDQRRNLSTDSKLFLTSIYRKAYGGGEYQTREVI